MIYVHVPFCRSFCTYCDFYSEVAAKCRQNESELFDAFAQALYAEVKARGHEITDETNTLYIGGGTPSVLPLSVFKGLLDALSEAGHGGPYEEFTVEVNPEDIVEKGEAYVEGLLKLGVNRISMGVQSFDDGILKFMNRRHDADTARRAYAVLENAGVRNISIDLIFGLPQLSDEQWTDTLKKALEISPSGVLPQHISSYQLSVEPGSMLAKLVERGRWEEASEELCEHQYDMLCQALGDAGYSHYEISNFARNGCISHHNLACWRGEDYYGLGPGAYGTICSTRYRNTEDTTAYIAALQAGRLPDFTTETITPEDRRTELLGLRLRTDEGLPPELLRPQDSKFVDMLVEEKLATLGAEGRLYLTLRGRLLADEIAVQLLG